MIDRTVSFRPSGSGTWSHCTAQLLFKDLSEQHPLAAKGNRIHTFCEEILKGRIPSVTLDYESKEQAKKYIKFVNTVRQESLLHQVEDRIVIAEVGNTICRGLVDFYAIYKAGEDVVMHAIDLKTGRLKASEDQIKTYIAGLYLKYRDTEYAFDKAIGTYFYCQTGEETSFNYSIDDLEVHLDWMTSVMGEFNEGKVTQKAGKHCEFCHMNDRCATLDTYLTEVEELRQFSMPEDILTLEESFLRVKEYGDICDKVKTKLREKILENREALVRIEAKEVKRGIVGAEAVEALTQRIKDGEIDLLDKMGKPSVATCRELELPIGQAISWNLKEKS